jgi:hypothetical protein
VKRASLLAALLLVSVGASAADPATAGDADDPNAKTMKASFIGEGGGYKASDKATDDYLLGGQNQIAPAAPAAAPSAPTATPSAVAPTKDGPAIVSEKRPAASAGVAASAGPAASGGVGASASAPLKGAAPSGSVAARLGSQERAASNPAEGRSPGRQSLWNGLVSPLSMTASQAASASDPDSARADADRDYETHILGMKPAPARAPLGVSGRVATAAAAASARAEGGKVFVSLVIDPREAGSLRDAVAGLGASAGFAADARFQALPAPGGRVSFSGWLPAGRLGDALSRPGVKSVQVESRPQPSRFRETSGEFLIGLRVDDAAQARRSVDAGVADLTSEAGFRLTKVIGLETAPDGRSVAVVSGFLPLSRLSKAMGLSAVAKIIPVGGEVPPPPVDSSPAANGKVGGFAKFAIQRGPWLIILTLLLLLPSLRAPARRAAAVFNPYR